MRDLLIFSGSSNPDLAERICRNLSLQPGEVELNKFSNGETQVMMIDSVREKDVFIIQSGSGHVNDNFLELLIMISACKMASAKRITAVLPLFPYSRQPDIPYNRSGAPLVSKPSKSSKYTFESVPGTPRMVSKFVTGANHDIPPITSSLKDPNFTNNGSSRATNSSSSSSSSSHFSPSRDPFVRSKSPHPSTPTHPLSQETHVTPISLPTNDSAVNINDKDSSNKSTVNSKAQLKSGYKQWIAQSGNLVANLLTTAGADHIITMDLHDPQFQGFFDIPVDNLYSKPLLQHYIVNYIPNYKDCVIVSPDAGGAKRAAAIADVLGLSFALIHKERRQVTNGNGTTTNNNNNNSSNSGKLANVNVAGNSSSVNSVNDIYSNNNYSQSNVMTPSLDGLMIHSNPSSSSLSSIALGQNYNNTPQHHNHNHNNNHSHNTPSISSEKVVATTMLVGDVNEKVCVLIDDLVDTSNTITRAAKLLKDQGATYVYALITHGIFSGDAVNRIKHSGIDKIITTNSVPQDEHFEELSDKIEVLDVSRILSEAIRRINNGESVSMLFDHGW